MAVEYSRVMPQPGFSAVSVPTLPLLGLSDSERYEIQRLTFSAVERRRHQALCEAYYAGEQIIDNLKIAVPDKVAAKLRTLVGWPRKGIDPYVTRLAVDGFRLKGATDADETLGDLWAASGMDAEFPLAVTDALVQCHSYIAVGTGREPGDPPLITVESPRNVSVLWDPTGRVPRLVLHEYNDGETVRATLMRPDQNVHLYQDSQGAWQVDHRDMHRFNRVMFHRMVHGARSHNRDGTSRITPSVMSIVDAACRTLLGLEVARELYSVPQKLLLGASEADFKDANGNLKTAWDTYITRTLAIERDDNGDLPTFHQSTPYDPTVFTRLIEMYASQMASEVDGTPQEFGLYTQGNPTSAEAALVNDAQRDRTAVGMQRMFSPTLPAVMQDAMRVLNGGRLPSEFERMVVDWADVSIQTPGVTSDAITKQIAADAIPARSDVVQKALGWSAVQRARMAQDRAEEDARIALASVADELRAQGERRTAEATDGGTTEDAEVA